MNATELIAALRADHIRAPEWPDICDVCEIPWPCTAAVAADRIEKALGCHTHPADGGLAMRAALSGES